MKIFKNKDGKTVFFSVEKNIQIRYDIIVAKGLNNI